MSVQIRGGQIQNDAISADKLQSNSVTAAKIQSAAVTQAKIANFAVGQFQLANGSVVSGKIATGAVSAASCDLTSTWDFSSGTLQAGTPSNASDVANKSYVDGIVGGGVYWKEPARVASTANINLSNPGTDTFDNVQLFSGDRILVKNQTSQSENGVYDFNGSSSAMTRSSDANTAEEINGLAIFVSEGDDNADQGYYQNSEIATLGSDNVTFVQFTGLGQIEAGDGLSKTANRLDIDEGAGLQIVSGQIAVETGAGLFIDTNAVAISVDDSTIEINGSNALQLKDGGITSAKIGTNQVTGNEIAGSTISTANLADSCISTAKLGSAVVTEAKLASLCISEGKLQSSAVTPSKLASSVAGDGLSYNSSTGLAVGVDDATIEINLDALRLKDLGIGTAKLQDSCITTSKLSDDSVSKAKLNADCAGNGLAQDGTGALEVSVGNGLQINTDQVEVRAGDALDFDAGVLDVQVDDATVEVNGSNQVQVKNLGISTAKLQDSCITTLKLSDDAVSAVKVAFRPYQELTSISGSSTASIDLAREVHSNFQHGIMAYKNGLALLNQTALGSSATNNDEFTLSVVGGVTRLSFGASLNDGDDILVVYMT